MNESLKRYGRTAPLAALALTAVFFATQAGCGDDSEIAPGGGDPANSSSSSSSSSSSGASSSGSNVLPDGCRGDESRKVVGEQTFCCAADANSLCVGDEGARIGAACDTEGARRAAADQLITTGDVCVIESCVGDIEAEPFMAQAKQTSSQAVCTGGRWKVEGEVSVHEVVRVCKDGATVACGGNYGGGYGYGYDSNSITERTVVLTASTCTVGAGASTECPVGAL